MDKLQALDALIDAAEPLLGITVRPAWRVSVRTHLELSLRLAEAVASFALPDETEPAPIFQP